MSQNNKYPEDKNRRAAFSRMRTKLSINLSDKNILQLCSHFYLSASAISSVKRNGVTELWTILDQGNKMGETNVKQLIEALDALELGSLCEIVRQYSQEWLSNPKEVEPLIKPASFDPLVAQLSNNYKNLELGTVSSDLIVSIPKGIDNGEKKKIDLNVNLDGDNDHTPDALKIFSEFQSDLHDNLTEGYCKELANYMDWTSSECDKWCKNSKNFTTRIYDLLCKSPNNIKRMEILNTLHFALSLSRLEVLAQKLGNLILPR